MGENRPVLHPRRKGLAARTVSKPILQHAFAKRPTLADLLILFAIWLVYFLPFVVTSRTILPVDGHGIWALGAYGYPEPRLPNAYTLDPDGAIGGDIAFNKYAADSLRRGIIPFWNPYQGLGEQFLAEGGSMVLYPINWLHLLLPVKDWDYVKFLHLFLAGCFFYVLAKEIGLGRGYAIICGCCAYAAGFFQGFLLINTMAAGFVWTPLVLAGVERIFRTKSIRAGLLPTAIGTFFLGTGCHPGFGVSIACVFAVYVAARSLWERDLSAPVRIGVPVLIGLLCAAPNLMPFIQNAYLSRAELGTVKARLQWDELPLMLLPQIYAPLHRDGAFGDPLGYRANYEPFGWIVPPVTYCAIAGGIFAFVKRNRPITLFTAITLWLWLWITAVKPFNITSYIPLLSRASPFYTVGVIQMLMCVLAAYGVAMLAQKGSPRIWIWLNVVWTALIVALAAIALRVFLSLAHPDMILTERSVAVSVAWVVAPPVLMWWARRKNNVYLVMSAVLIAAGISYFPSGASEFFAQQLRGVPLLALLAAGLLVGLARRWRPRTKWAVVLGALALINLVRVEHVRAWPKRYDPYAEPAFIKYLAANSISWRTYTTDSFVFPDLASGYPFSSINLLASITPPSSYHYFELLDPLQGPQTFYGIASPEPGTDGTAINPLLERQRYWDYVGVRYAVVTIGHNFMSKYVPDVRAEAPIENFDPVELTQKVEFPIDPRGSADWIELLVGTYGRRNTGHLLFELKDASGKVVISDARDATNLFDNAYIQYYPPDRLRLTPQVYTATVSFAPSSPGAMLAIWRNAKVPNDYRHLLFARKEGRFTQVLNDPPARAQIVRVESAQPIVYVAPESAKVGDAKEGLQRFSQAADLRRVAYLESGDHPVCAGTPSFPAGSPAANVSNIRVEPNRVQADVDAKIAGTLMLVSNYSPGWSARINGSPAKVYRANGSFQGACLAAPGRYQVEFSFEPPLWRAGLASSAVGWLILLTWVIRGRKGPIPSFA